jgi:2-oxoglutarate ferredoxin oxidoreductase subunit delta
MTTASQHTSHVPRGTVVMALERCKGCGLCVPVCMPRVLEMTDERNAKGYVLPRLLDGCTGCRACADICPDYVFEVYRFDHVDAADTAGTADSNEAS